MTIPKIAWFHWSQNGPEMSWLRWAALRSFKRLNPDWDIRLIPTDPEFCDRGLCPAQEADATWWKTLAIHGGWQVATDIVFLRPIPPEWSETPFNGCRNGVCGIYQFAMLGAEPGHPYMKQCYGQARRIVSEGLAPEAYQALGVELLKENGRYLEGSFFDQPMNAFCEVECGRLEILWGSEDVPLSDQVIGVHWYGGGQASRAYEPAAGPGSNHFIVRLAERVLTEGVIVTA